MGNFFIVWAIGGIVLTIAAAVSGRLDLLAVGIVGTIVLTVLAIRDKG